MIIPQMRRADRQVPTTEAESFLQRGEFGTLATISLDGMPHAVPLHYVVLERRIYFHCAREGLKLANLRERPQVCFSVVAQAEVLPDVVSTAYQSVVAYGRATVVEHDEERLAALSAFMTKYTRMSSDAAKAYATKRLAEPLVVRIDVEALTGKNRIKP